MAEKNPFTESTIRCLKCVSFVLKEFPKIMQKIMEHSGLSAKFVYTTIQNDSEFDRKLTRAEKQAIQTLTSDGYKNLDVTLIYKIITHFKMLLPTPTRGWGSEPGPSEKGIGDDVERLRLKRNHFLHKATNEINEKDFEAFFAEVASLCGRVDQYLSCTEEDSFKRKVDNYKSEPISDPEEVRQQYNKQKPIIEFCVIQTGKYEFKVYKTRSLTDFVQHILEDEEHDGINAVPITLTFDEIQSNPESIKMMNDLRGEINSNLVNVKFKECRSGSLIVDIIFTFFGSYRDDYLERDLKLLLDYVSSHNFFDEALSKVSTVAIVMSEYEAFRVDAENEVEQRCHTPGSLQLDIQLNKDVLQSDEKLQTVLQNVLNTVVSHSNGNQTFPSDEPVVSIIEPGKIDDDTTRACRSLSQGKDPGCSKKVFNVDATKAKEKRRLDISRSKSSIFKRTKSCHGISPLKSPTTNKPFFSTSSSKSSTQLWMPQGKYEKN